ncbi:hypothetical protein OFC56_36115, partial [Escherichia coli]|nr:hypothetical protein [Escherichia coli]
LLLVYSALSTLVYPLITALFNAQQYKEYIGGTMIGQFILAIAGGVIVVVPCLLLFARMILWQLLDLPLAGLHTIMGVDFFKVLV